MVVQLASGVSEESPVPFWSRGFGEDQAPRFSVVLKHGSPFLHYFFPSCCLSWMPWGIKKTPLECPRETALLRFGSTSLFSSMANLFELLACWTAECGTDGSLSAGAEPGQVRGSGSGEILVRQRLPGKEMEPRGHEDPIVLPRALLKYHSVNLSRGSITLVSAGPVCLFFSLSFPLLLSLHHFVKCL